MTIGGCIYAIVFMLVWCGVAAAIGVWFMLIFGIPMLGFVIFRMVILIQKSREKSADPWEQPACQSEIPGGVKVRFCQYCSEETKDTFVFCPKCGRRQQ